MKINIKATNISMTPAISDYAQKKVEALDKFFRGEQDVLVNVEVGKTTHHHKSGDVFRAETRVVLDGQEYYAAVEKDDLYAAIDEVKDAMARELTSNRKRAVTLVRRGGAMLKNWVKGFGRRRE